MKFRLLDILCCPYDSTHPLELKAENADIVAARPGKVPSTPPCRTYCGYEGRDVGDSGAPCAECYELEVVKGSLHCGTCSRTYPIIDRIPSIMPDELKEGVSSNPHDEVADAENDYHRKQEMETRDKEVTDTIKRPPLHQYLKDLEIESIVSQINSFGGPRDRVLDIGVGNGESALRYLPYYNDAVSADFSLKSLILADRLFRSNGLTNIHPVQMDVCFMPFRAGAFDMAVSMVTLHHLPEKALRAKAFENIHHVLADKGAAIITVYNDHLLKKYDRRKKKADYHSYALKEGRHSTGIYYYNYSSKEIESELGEFFDTIDIKGIAPIVSKLTTLSQQNLIIGSGVNFLIDKSGLSTVFGNLLLARAYKGKT